MTYNVVGGTLSPTQSNTGWSVASVTLCASACVSVCVRTVKVKRLELSTPNVVRRYFTTVARHALILKSKGQRSRSHS